MKEHKLDAISFTGMERNIHAQQLVKATSPKPENTISKAPTL